WRDELSESSKSADLESFINHVNADHLPHAVLMDATASSELTTHYEIWLSQGINIITPNKKSNAGPLAAYRSLRETARRHQGYFLYETNVGGALTITSALPALVAT